MKDLFATDSIGFEPSLITVHSEHLTIFKCNIQCMLGTENRK
jgi:hypothetical protein